MAANELYETRPSTDIIVCASRGGEGSRAALQAATDYARESNTVVRFLYIVDELQFSDVEPVLKPALMQELLWTGRTLMELASRRGNLAGVTCEVVIRQGRTRDAIVTYMLEHQVKALFLGAPRGTTANIFGDDEIEQFAMEIEKQTNAKVAIVRPEDMVSNTTKT
ncbi:MAG: universal stress protein [Candidatus Promineifilaceae bacterium]